MRISYAITVFNEWEEIQKLIPFLLEHKREQDEIVVLWDDKGDQRIPNYFGELIGKVSFHSVEFNKNFADLKNTLNSLCSRDIIVNFDADEIPSKTLIEQLPQILEINSPFVDAIWVPRINIVQGIGLSKIQEWGWNVSTVEDIEDEKILDLDNPQDLDEYNLLKKYNLIIEENIFSE